jgi:hypothetical protein
MIPSFIGVALLAPNAAYARRVGRFIPGIGRLRHC